MYLALKEIRHEKLRYSLIVAMIVLVTYLIFVLSGLATGLAGENTEAIDSWDAKSITLNKDADINLSSSTITEDQMANVTLTGYEAVIGQAPVVAKQAGHKKESAVFLGIDPDQFIAQDMKIAQGRKASGDSEVVVEEQFKTDGYHLGDKITFNGFSKKFKIVGFIKNAKLNVAPVIYGSMGIWKQLREAPPGVKLAGSAIISKKAKFIPNSEALKRYSINRFIQELPGYTAENTTFDFMIGFLMVISLVIIAVFLYILTVQALPTYAVLRAQGVPARALVTTIIAQSLMLMLAGIIIGTVLTVITAGLIPFGAPVSFNVPMLAMIALGLLVMGVIGAAIPARKIAKVDPVEVIGG